VLEPSSEDGTSQSGVQACRRKGVKAGEVVVGERIVAARKARGLSVEDVAAATRLRPMIIEALEADDYSLSGGEAYVVGHLRMIAEVVGLDGDDLVDEFYGD
jgi:cytoskeleton protein RodZ